MMMVELTSVPSAALPISALADHLRLSSGFADDGSQDARLEACLRAAAASIEARIGKALFERRFALTLSDGWRDASGHGLPLAPVSTIDSVKLVDRAGAETVVDAGRYGLKPDAHRPRIVPMTGALPCASAGGTIEVEFTAGFATEWTGIPADLREALLSLAAEFYNQDVDTGAVIPAHVAVLIEPHRHLRLRGGAS